jgi:FkbM family methyltransferase
LIRLFAPPANTFIGRISRSPLKILPRDWAVPILQGPLRGKKWVIGSQRHAFWLGIYEPHMQSLITKVVKKGGVFYDIGANVGFYSLLASTMVFPGKVYAFEPVAENVRYIQRHLTLNDIPNVEVLELAICDQVGTSTFQEEETRAMGHLQAEGKTRVQTTTLDSLLQAQLIEPPQCIKMDIEGAELIALRGASECIQRHRPIIFLATHGRDMETECGRLLSSWGYELQNISDSTSTDRAEFLAKIKS